jgi:hypothetical protein
MAYQHICNAATVRNCCTAPCWQSSSYGRLHKYFYLSHYHLLSSCSDLICLLNMKWNQQINNIHFPPIGLSLRVVILVFWTREFKPFTMWKYSSSFSYIMKRWYACILKLCCYNFCICLWLYDFYLPTLKTIFYLLAALIFTIFAPLCKILYNILY